MATQTYSMETLSAETGIAARTLRSWIGRRLLPKPIGRSRAARYDESHALRARVIERLRNGGHTLRAIRSRIAPLSPSELTALLPNKRLVDEHGVPPPPPATNYPFTMCEVVELMPGLKLMVEPNSGPASRRIADEICRHYSMRPTRS
jgi:DNA-binding transcriptional MerR regulator